MTSAVSASARRAWERAPTFFISLDLSKVRIWASSYLSTGKEKEHKCFFRGIRIPGLLQ